MKRIVLGLLVGLVLTVTPASAADHEMRERHAGKYYLKHVCASNRAVDRFYARIWKGRKYIYRREVRRRLPAIRHQSAILGNHEHHFAAALYNPPGDWPTKVRRNVNVMARKTSTYSSILLDMADAGNAERWMRLDARANRVYNSSSTTSERIRAKLDLPPPGKGC